MFTFLNRAFLRASIGALARALYIVDFSQYLECGPAEIKELLEEHSIQSLLTAWIIDYILIMP